jgi:hypothetical protein
MYTQYTAVVGALRDFMDVVRNRLRVRKLASSFPEALRPQTANPSGTRDAVLLIPVYAEVAAARSRRKVQGELREVARGWKAAIDQWLARPASQPRLAAHQVSCASFPHFPMEKWHCGLAWLVGVSTRVLECLRKDGLVKPRDLVHGNGKTTALKQAILAFGSTA